MGRCGVNISMEEVLMAWSVPLMTLLIVAEIAISAWRHDDVYNATDTRNNLLFTALNFTIAIATRGFTIWILAVVFNASPMRWSVQGWQYWLALFLLQDIAYYALHCADHYVRLFWATHVTHHNSEKFNLTVSIRSSVFQPMYRFLFYLPLAGFGFEPMHIMFMYAACQAYGFWVHTEYIGKLGWLEYVLVTPSHHRVHHASNLRYLDKNMGMVLIVWDKLFGTFQEEMEEEKPVYGTTSTITSTNPLHHLTDEWRKLAADVGQPLPLTTRLKYIFYPPGWSHNGKSLTSAQMRAEVIAVQENEVRVLEEALA